ncbi:PREDICTED: olfactory receptor 1002-like [Ceratotherium simum simum]|uniref:Olfactory receptor n=1 Tax=Ceratotherium simum simum TaxID=73337 RepID=A0ABM1D9V1_CERSS|nr:PREDICTED: olfactory receptor 1002-like [Ceratotherium simum simum]
MDYGNQTLVTEFFFVGLTNHFHHQVVLFVIFLLVYLISLLGNLGMITLICMDSRLHTPMYFFLSHLSFVDVCSSSVIGPKMLTDIFVQKKVISFFGCALQLWFFVHFVVTECFLLASMAYDRYMAICKPLLYTFIMSQRVCVQLVVGPYTVGLLIATTHTTSTFCLPYCGPNIINHFFCDLLPILSLACADTQVNQVLLSILAGAVGVLSGVIILVSYIYIVIAVLRIRSADGRRKAFSTCTSHLTAVSILYGTLFFIYVHPNSSFSLDIDKVVSVFYTAVVPMLNPVIYSLRNKEVQDSFRRVFERKKFLMCR